MAIDLTLHVESDDDIDIMEEESERPSLLDGEHDNALLAAVKTWHVMRESFDSIDPARLSAASRETYSRMLARIGLWADARAFGEPIESE